VLVLPGANAEDPRARSVGRMFPPMMNMLSLHTLDLMYLFPLALPRLYRAHYLHARRLRSVLHPIRHLVPITREVIETGNETSLYQEKSHQVLRLRLSEFSKPLNLNSTLRFGSDRVRRSISWHHRNRFLRRRRKRGVSGGELPLKTEKRIKTRVGAKKGTGEMRKVRQS
jgi:hypothetical protein